MISIIIPARNEEAHLGRTLSHLRKCAPADAEIIVAEGGSQDRTADVARRWATVVHGSDCTRAALMNAGARAARGDVFFFLHADSFPPPGFSGMIREALSAPEVVGGAFEQQFIEPVFGLRVATAVDRLRYRLTKNYFGDQGIFVRRDAFKRAGGFPNKAILEDVAFCMSMRRTGRTVLIRRPLPTSGRRFLRGGIARTFLWIAVLLLRHRLGIDTERYAAAYRKENERRKTPFVDVGVS
ncbi:MAG: TIGR04283 family arsenosugar biosynthesis glycosyltransferase [Syntrophobacteraceae bacterium]